MVKIKTIFRIVFMAYIPLECYFHTDHDTADKR